MEIDLSKQYQSMLVLWFALLMSVGMYFLFSLFVPSRMINEPNNPPSSMLFFVITVLGALFVIGSFALKKKVLERSVEKQDVSLVRKAMVMACAMCEMTAMLGLVEHFVIGSRVYYLLFVLAAGGIALHFPRLIHLEAASYRSRSTLN
jgi:hypothetical protein